MNKKKILIIVFLFIFAAFVCFAVSGAYAFLTSKSEIVKSFVPLNNEIAIDVNNYAVKNTGTTSAYIRVFLAFENGDATVSNMGVKWVKDGDYYYYTEAVSVGYATSSIGNLSGNGRLIMYAESIDASYVDSDGTVNNYDSYISAWNAW